jgi:hypothetical protein
MDVPHEDVADPTPVCPDLTPYRRCGKYPLYSALLPTSSRYGSGTVSSFCPVFRVFGPALPRCTSGYHMENQGGRSLPCRNLNGTLASLGICGYVCPRLTNLTLSIIYPHYEISESQLTNCTCAAYVRNGDHQCGTTSSGRRRETS